MIVFKRTIVAILVFLLLNKKGVIYLKVKTAYSLNDFAKRKIIHTVRSLIHKTSHLFVVYNFSDDLCKHIHFKLMYNLPPIRYRFGSGRERICTERIKCIGLNNNWWLNTASVSFLLKFRLYWMKFTRNFCVWHYLEAWIWLLKSF